jgi:hypothetical protein
MMTIFWAFNRVFSQLLLPCLMWAPKGVVFSEFNIYYLNWPRLGPLLPSPIISPSHGPERRKQYVLPPPGRLHGTATQKTTTGTIPFKKL